MKNRQQIAVLACQTCSGMTKQMLPRLQLHFGEKINIVPVSCPGNLKPLSHVALLRQGWAGVVIICPKDTCCCPSKKIKSVMRSESLKSVLPVFDIAQERLEVITASPFQVEEVQEIIEKMISYTEAFSDGKYLYDHIDREAFLFNTDISH